MIGKYFNKLSLICVLLGVFIFLFTSVYLRPSADDYCLGAHVAMHGFFDAMALAWNGWSSFELSIFLNYLLVGIPLAILPTSLSSAITCVVAFIFMAYISYLIIAYHYDRISHSNIFLFLFCAFLWITFVFTDSLAFLTLSHPFKQRVSFALLHWQNINATYVFGMLLIILSFLWYLRAKWSNLATFIFACVIGVFIGSIGLAVTLAFFSVIFCFICFQYYKKELTKQRALFFISIMCISIFVLIVSMVLSPGHAKRLSSIAPDVSFSLERVADVLMFTIFPGLERMARLYVNLGNIFIMLLAILFRLHFWHNFTPRSGVQTWQTALFLTFACLTFGLVARFSQAFSYVAYWHYVPAMILQYFSLILWSFVIAEKLQPYIRTEKAMKRVSMSFLCMLLINVLFMAAAAEKIHARAEAWAVGPAPLSGIRDIEEKGGWRHECWEDLNKHRDVPFEERVCK